MPSTAARRAGKLGPAALRRKLAAVRLLSVDVDGVLTDGGLYYADDGSQLRKFNSRDGMGLQLVRKAGVEVTIVTASRAQAIAVRGRDLGLRYVRVGVEHKLAAVRDVAEGLGVPLSAVAHIGDDLNDLPVFEAAGLSLTVADATAAAKRAAHFVTRAKGGEGAVRELCELILAARAPAAAKKRPARKTKPRT